MKNVFKKILSVVLVMALVASASLAVPPVTADAADEVTIIGTIIQTRSYYMANGPVCAYGFLPAVLTEVKVDGKTVELTECGVGTTDTFGTNDLSGFVGMKKAYKGKIYKNKKADPYKYSFALTGVEELPAGAQTGTRDYMDAYLQGLGYTTECIEYSPGEMHLSGRMNNGTVDFYFYIHNGIWGEISAVVAKPDFTGAELQYMVNAQACGGYAKAQKVAKIFAQFASGAITKDAAQKALDSLL